MTIEEAIEYLKHADITVGKETKTRTAEALEMAIKALEYMLEDWEEYEEYCKRKEREKEE